MGLSSTTLKFQLCDIVQGRRADKAHKEFNIQICNEFPCAAIRRSSKRLMRRMTPRQNVIGNSNTATLRGLSALRRECLSAVRGIEMNINRIWRRNTASPIDALREYALGRLLDQDNRHALREFL